jgi:hypothetical protein
VDTRARNMCGVLIACSYLLCMLTIAAVFVVMLAIGLTATPAKRAGICGDTLCGYDETGDIAIRPRARAHTRTRSHTLQPRRAVFRSRHDAT